MLACLFWITFPLKEWRRETGFDSWVWCMIFLISSIFTFLFFGGAALDGTWTGGMGTVIEQVKYTIRRSEWLFAEWFALDRMDFKMNGDYWLGHYPFLYFLPIYGTFIHVFFKPTGRFRSWK